MNYIEHNVTCDLRWMGFDGDDITQIMSDDNMTTEHQLKCEVSYSPTSMGPFSWFIVITLSAGSAAVGKAFLTEFGKDLYKWSKEKLQPIFKAKSNGDGCATVKFDDVSIEVPFHPSEDAFADVWFCISDILKSKDLSASEHWTIEKSDNGLGYDLIPVDDLSEGQ